MTCTFIAQEGRNQEVRQNSPEFARPCVSWHKVYQIPQDAKVAKPPKSKPQRFFKSQPRNAKQMTYQNTIKNNMFLITKNNKINVCKKLYKYCVFFQKSKTNSIETPLVFYKLWRDSRHNTALPGQVPGRSRAGPGQLQKSNKIPGHVPGKSRAGPGQLQKH